VNNSVSVLATVKNESNNIGYLIQSVLDQSYHFDEFVINDNKSTDNTVEIIKKYAQLDDRIKVVNSGDLSIGEGRNAAISHSSGDILAIIDSGIVPSLDWLSNVVSPMLEDDSVDVVWGHVIFDTKSRVVRSSSIALALVFLTKYPENRVDAKNVTSSAIRRRVWEDLNGFPTISLPIEDLLLIYEIKRNNYKCIHAPLAKVYYFRYPETLLEVYKKWKYSAYCAFAVKKSERGFGKQVFIMGLFFILFILVFIDVRMLALVLLYIFIFFLYKSYSNIPLAKKIFLDFSIFIITLELFFILNVARAVGVFRAIVDSLYGKLPKTDSK
jgi:glycosyltransferase involved in cell wall biosynthesis